jgi:DNA-binding beta-propeller fold protein YncE
VVDDATHTVYVANNADGDAPGTVSVINAATCDGTRTGGCHASFPVMPAGVGPSFEALDPATGLLYVTDFNSAAVTVLSTAGCKAEVTAGCGQPGHQQSVESDPVGIVIAGCSVYVGQAYLTGSMAIFGA